MTQCWNTGFSLAFFFESLDSRKSLNLIFKIIILPNSIDTEPLVVRFVCHFVDFALNVTAYA